MKELTLKTGGWMEGTEIERVSSRCAYDEYVDNLGQIFRLVNVTFKYLLTDRVEIHEDYVNERLATEFADWVERMYVYSVVTGGSLPEWLGEVVEFPFGKLTACYNWHTLWSVHGPYPDRVMVMKAIDAHRPPEHKPVFQRRVAWTLTSGWQCSRCGQEGGRDWQTVLRGRFSFGWVPGRASNREILFRQFGKGPVRKWRHETYALPSIGLDEAIKNVAGKCEDRAKVMHGFGELAPMDEGGEYMPGDPYWRPDESST